ncbi:MAG: class I SAM-dependent methyltransferase [Myxococcales bacterium]|nr:class I SAM-dependent methyltransferase [Myxococcales bacterium]
MSFLHPALRVFDRLSVGERLFVRARLLSAPLEEVARRVEGPRVLDVGCGHGVLCALLAVGFPDRLVVGIDPDPRKVDWARASVGRLPHTRFEAVTVDALAQREPASFDTVTVADVLYLLPSSGWPDFLRACHRSLKPGGQLLLKEAEDDGSWRVRKALLQEKVMVGLGRTRASGGLGFQPREVTLEALRGAGFRVKEVLKLSRGSTTPHVLFEARSV